MITKREKEKKSNMKNMKKFVGGCFFIFLPKKGNIKAKEDWGGEEKGEKEWK